jgi:RimJ/RimL family protein N-acetyltransferase
MPHLVGRHIILREYRESDFESIRAWVNDPETTAYLSSIFDRVQTEPMTRNFFDQVLTNKIDAHMFVIARKKDERYLGQIDLRLGDRASRNAELGIIVPSQRDRGRGYGREAMELILAFGFDTLNLHKIWLRVFVDNDRAIALYRTLGFVHEGVLRDDLYRGGRYLDAMVMSILEAEWRDAREGADST